MRKYLFFVFCLLSTMGFAQLPKYNWFTQIKAIGATDYSVATFDGTTTDTIKSTTVGYVLTAIAGAPGFEFLPVTPTLTDGNGTTANGSAIDLGGDAPDLIEINMNSFNGFYVNNNGMVGVHLGDYNGNNSGAELGIASTIMYWDDPITANHTNSFGINTVSPSEALHVVGSVRMEDGSEALGYVLTSSATGVGMWAEIDVVADGVTITGDGTVATPLTVDTTVIATQYDLTQKKDLFTIDVKMLSTNLADGITYFIGNIPQTPITANIDRNRIDIPYDCTLVGASIMFASFSAVGTNENISIYVRVNNTTDHLVATVGAATADRLFENMSLSVALTPSDYIHGKIVCPTWSTNPTQTVVGGTLYFER